MRFQANYISTSVAGDYYQAMFAAEDDSPHFSHALRRLHLRKKFHCDIKQA